MRAYIGLGSNLGDREGNIQQALRLLREAGVVVEAVSSIYESEPVGDIKEQPWFLNCVAKIEVDFEPQRLLEILQSVQRALGQHEPPGGGPRLIDLDIILVEDLVVNEDKLKIPHPRFRERAFVLMPLAEIAGDEVDPVSGKRIKELLADLKGHEIIRLYRSRGGLNNGGDGTVQDKDGR